MKRFFNLTLLLAFFSFSAFAQDQQPGGGGPSGCNGSHNLEGPSSTNLCANEYCYCVKQTSSDSWDYTIYPVGNEAGMAMEFQYDEVFCCGGGTVHHPWATATFPLMLGAGSGSMATNIQIRILAYAVAPGGPGGPGTIGGGGHGTGGPSDRCMVGFIDGYVGWLYNVNICR